MLQEAAKFRTTERVLIEQDKRHVCGLDDSDGHMSSIVQSIVSRTVRPWSKDVKYRRFGLANEGHLQLKIVLSAVRQITPGLR